MGRGGFSWHKSTHSSMMEKRLQQLLSGLPPINFSLRPRDIERDRPWPEIRCGGCTAVAKSWLPMATRCGRAHGRPQLRHFAAGPPESPIAHPHNHFLGDPSCSALVAAFEMEDGGASHWCLLEYSGSRRISSDGIGPRMKLARVTVGPNAPCSGLTAFYSALPDYGVSSTCWWMYRHLPIRYECAVPDPFDAKKKPMEFTSVVRCAGKFYAISLQGAVAVMEVLGTRLHITAVSSTRALPMSRSRFFKEYLVEMKGEILMVYLIHEKSLEVVDDVEVFRLDLDKLEWDKVERLRGKTMFLKELRCDWVESAVFGCRDDCVFFTEGKENKWRVYDFKTRCISFV